MPVTGRKTRRISPARQAAFEVLRRTEAGAYASDSLRSLTSDLDQRDAALARQIAFGTLRFRAQLDYLIYVHSGRSVTGLDREVSAILRMAIFQIRYLDRVPSHASVHEAVELAKAHRRAASGFVNAVLRKVNRQPVKWPDQATELSCPEWLLERWETHFGKHAAEEIAKAFLQEPEEYIRLASPPGGEVRMLDAEATAVPGAFRLRSNEKGRNQRRLFDISSQAIVPLLELQPGERLLDLCSAPGNKTRQALETPLRMAVACDISLARLLTVDAPCRVLLDGTGPLPFPPNSFDAVFIDAPCSGTGTIGRNPEIKWRVQPQDFDRFGEKQRALVEQGLQVLTPTGRLLYATCSLEREENEAVIERILGSHPGFQVVRQLWRLPGRDPGDGFYAALLRRRP